MFFCLRFIRKLKNGTNQSYTFMIYPMIHFHFVLPTELFELLQSNVSKFNNDGFGNHRSRRHY